MNLQRILPVRTRSAHVPVCAYMQTSALGYEAGPACLMPPIRGGFAVPRCAGERRVKPGQMGVRAFAAAFIGTRHPARLTRIASGRVRSGEWLVFGQRLVYLARMSNDVRIAPSILSADLGHLAREIADVEAAGAGWIHVDVVDGRFAPHLTFGPGIVKAARRATRLPIDVHLMVNEPERYLKAFADAGADHLTVHGEACRDLRSTLAQIRALGKRAGVALRPETPIDTLQALKDAIDIVLVLCVNPGQAGQAFMESQIPKMAAVRKMIDQSGHPIDLEVDGGISLDNAARTVAAGARVLVSGSKIFDTPDRAATIAAFLQAANPRH